MDTVLITGANGFLGASLVKGLARHDYRLILLVRDKVALCQQEDPMLYPEWENTSLYSTSGIEVIKSDITLPYLGIKRGQYNRLCQEVDTIFQCAALTDFSDSHALLHVNVGGTKNLLHFALRGRRKHFHHISSAYVAGNSSGTFYEGELYKGQSFNNTYEETKFLAEELVRAYARRYALPFTIYRPSIIVGDSRTGYTRNFKGMYVFARALFLLRERIRLRINGHLNGIETKPKGHRIHVPMRILGDPEALINPVPVDYVASAIVEIARSKEGQNNTFHLTNPIPPTLSELSQWITHALDIDGVMMAPLRERTSSLSAMERFYLLYTRPYLPYVQSKLRFDTSNTRRILKRSGIRCPEINQELISLLMDFALSGNWGRLGVKELAEVSQ